MPHRVNASAFPLSRLCIRIIRVGARIFSAEAAGLVGIVAVVANQMLALVGDMLDEFREEVERLEELVVAGDAAEEVFAGGLGVSLTVVLLGFVEHFAGGCNADESGKAEWAACQVLSEAFESVAVTSSQADAPVDVKSAVSPGEHLLDNCVFDSAFV